MHIAEGLVEGDVETGAGSFLAETLTDGGAGRSLTPPSVSVIDARIIGNDLTGTWHHRPNSLVKCLRRESAFVHKSSESISHSRAKFEQETSRCRRSEYLYNTADEWKQADVEDALKMVRSEEQLPFKPQLAL
ncbi:hypothetical protein AXW83_23105 [Bosea sp. PAMC 26642]|nr:hypothetical protein AXW83_23105 [Bosea sp. PAMC 26642]